MKMWEEYKLHKVEVGKKKRKPNQNPHTKLSGKNKNNSMKLNSSMSVIDTLEHQKGLKHFVRAANEMWIYNVK